MRVLSGVAASLFSERFIDASSGSPVRGMPKLGSLGVAPGRGGPLTHAQVGVLVGAEEALELEVVARRAVERRLK